jgi:peptide/nickel transport system permease protein
MMRNNKLKSRMARLLKSLNSDNADQDLAEIDNKAELQTDFSITWDDEIDKVSIDKENMFLVILGRLVKNKLAVVGGIFVIIVILIAIFAPLVAPYDYKDQDLPNRNKTPTLEHWFGTDNLGRDILSRVIFGARNSLSIGLISISISAFIGVILGSITGYYGGWLDTGIMRLMDVLQTVPALLLAIAVAATLGPGYVNCIIALIVSRIPAFVRMMRASCLNVYNMEYIEAARAINANTYKIITKHMIPNAIAPVFVQATMGLAQSILVVASLSFIGLGVRPPAAEWGGMLSEGRSFIRSFPHMVIFPGIVLILTVLSINLVGDSLRDALDPRLKD